MGNGHTGSPLWTDRHMWKHFLPVTSLAGGNKGESPRFEPEKNSINLLAAWGKMVTEKAKKYHSICEINFVSLSILFTVIHMTLLFITASQRSCWKVMFSVMSVSHSVHVLVSLYDPWLWSRWSVTGHMRQPWTCSKLFTWTSPYRYPRPARERTVDLRLKGLLVIFSISSFTWVKRMSTSKQGFSLNWLFNRISECLNIVVD